MATFTVIDASKAPARTKPGGRLKDRMAQYERYVAGVKKGQAGTLKPDASETARGVALRVTRAGKRAGVAIETWIVEGVIYFKVG